MSKKCLVEREKKRLRFVKSSIFIRNNISYLGPVDYLFHSRVISRNSNPCRLRNRCYISGRPRGVFSRFGISRIFIRNIASSNLIPGFYKVSW
ncbi:30S ribosomal protein S14 [Candidatus Vidania fulgoroideorum]